MYKGLSLEQAPPYDVPFRFFFSAPFFGMLAGLVIMMKGQDLFIDRWLFELIALTHIFTLGWLTMIMMGAFYQMIPVLIGGTVPNIRLARWVHGFFCLGVLSLIVGVYYVIQPVLIVAICALLLSTLVFLFQTLSALYKVSADRPTASAMKVSILSFIATLGFGLYLAGGYAGLWEFPVERPIITGTHITFALLGWVGCLILGVAFHVVPMFYMSEDFSNAKSRNIIRAVLLSLVLVPAALLTKHEAWALPAGLPAIVAMVAFIFELSTIIKKRKRKKADFTLQFWKVALTSLVLSLIALVASLTTSIEVLPVLFGVLYIFGFAILTTNGMLYKILPFLVWFHRFSPLVGKVPVPLLKDILSEEKMKTQFYVVVIFVVTIVAGLLMKNDLIIRASGMIQIVSSILVLMNFIQINAHRAPVTDPVA